MNLLTISLLLYFTCAPHHTDSEAWIRINQIGYLPESCKVAVLVSKQKITCDSFYLCDKNTNKKIWSSKTIQEMGAYGPFLCSFRLDFSDFKKAGEYYLISNKIRSTAFTIDYTVYDDCADFLLNYMRQQRCGYNPFLQDSCHTHDGFSVYGPMPDGTHVNVTGGWHDAADYLQYVTTSANATFNLLFAYRDNVSAFADEYSSNGLPGSNGIADVLDEARWGLEWLLKMFPRENIMFNQIADDRDHAGFRLPTQDSVSYGKGLERPVYFCSGEVQGLGNYKNRTTGVASTAGKFASAFALGSQIYRKIEPEFSDKLAQKVHGAYIFGEKKPGACQTAPCKAPYFYEEDNWTDDMELAAAELFIITGKAKFRDDAIMWSRKEPITPWMGADTARHYQWYPFINKGHYELANTISGDPRSELVNYYRDGITRVWEKGRENPFLMGVPFIWCSNNLTAAFVTQCYLFRCLSSDSSYIELEAAMRDWLFGCNPWGVSMVVGLPEDGVTAQDPHSSLSYLYGYDVNGGLLDGPVYGTIFNSLKYVELSEEDEYAPFQSDLVVYHDDMGDYATNEPTMDGTATLIYFLAAMAKEGRVQKKKSLFEVAEGAIIRGDKNKKELSLVFTGDEYADGGEYIRDLLTKYSIKGSFFLTGNFYRNKNFTAMIQGLKQDGHYLGPHSDKHLLYCSWENQDSLLVTREQFLSDLNANYQELEKFGISKFVSRYFLPPFEWYNASVSNWADEVGVTLINYTPGTRSHADYTIPEMGSQYVTSEQIIDSIYDYENTNPNGLNGFILLSHIGTQQQRKDKFYFKLDELIKSLLDKGYNFKRIDELLQ